MTNTIFTQHGRVRIIALLSIVSAAAESLDNGLQQARLRCELGTKEDKVLYWLTPVHHSLSKLADELRVALQFRPESQIE